MVPTGRVSDLSLASMALTSTRHLRVSALASFVSESVSAILFFRSRISVVSPSECEIIAVRLSGWHVLLHFVGPLYLKVGQGRVKTGRIQFALHELSHVLKSRLK